MASAPCPADPLAELVPMLQTAVGPVILISGVGLLLLSMTNRYGRVIDRSRELVQKLRQAAAPEHRRLLAEIEMLYRRARLLRSTITLAAFSALMAALLVVALFVAAAAGWPAGPTLGVLFVLCMVAISASLVLFLGDLRISLQALRLEVADARRLGDGSGAAR